MSNRREWLLAEIDRWVRDGVVDPSIADRLRAMYPPGAAGSRSVARIGLSVLGALLLGGGIILLLAHNWADLSRPMRTAVALAPLVIAQALAVWGAFRGHDGAGWREGLGVFWTLSIGAAIAMVGQVYHLSGSYDAFMMTWLILGAPVIYLMRSSLAAVLFLAGVVSWTGPHAGESAKALWFWPLAAVVVPLLLRSSAVGLFTSGLALLRWALAAALAAGVGMTLSHVIPGLWTVAYAALFAVYYGIDATLLRDAPSLWHRPMRVVGIAGFFVVALLLTYGWPWERIGWHHLRADAPMWHFVLDGGVVLALLGAATTLAVMRRAQLAGPGFFPTAFPALAAVGYVLTTSLATPVLSMLLINLYLFAFGVALFVSGLRIASLARVNAGMGAMAVLIGLRFFDSDLSLVSRGIVFVVLGAAFLTVNSILSRRFRRSA